jgi:hypothetical protein
MNCREKQAGQSRRNDNFFIIFLKTETEAHTDRERERESALEKEESEGWKRRGVYLTVCIAENLSTEEKLKRKKMATINSRKKKRKHGFRLRECNSNEKACGNNGRAERAYKKKNESGERERESGERTPSPSPWLHCCFPGHPLRVGWMDGK